MGDAENSENTGRNFGVEDISALVATAAVIVRLIREIQSQGGLSNEELWARADIKTQANKQVLDEWVKELQGQDTAE